MLNNFVKDSFGFPQCIGISANNNLNENEAIDPDLPPYNSG